MQSVNDTFYRSKLSTVYTSEHDCRSTSKVNSKLAVSRIVLTRYAFIKDCPAELLSKLQGTVLVQGDYVCLPSLHISVLSTSLLQTVNRQFASYPFAIRRDSKLGKLFDSSNQLRAKWSTNPITKHEHLVNYRVIEKYSKTFGALLNCYVISVASRLSNLRENDIRIDVEDKYSNANFNILDCFADILLESRLSFNELASCLSVSTMLAEIDYRSSTECQERVNYNSYESGSDSNIDFSEQIVEYNDGYKLILDPHITIQ